MRIELQILSILERVFAREYKFAVQPPLCEDCKTVNESAKKRTSNNSSNLMQRLLKKESTRLREKASAEVQVICLNLPEVIQ